MMYKFIICIIVVLFCVFCGYYFSRKYRKRKSFFCDLERFNGYFLNEITYTKRPIVEFVELQNFNIEFTTLINLFIKIHKNEKDYVGCYDFSNVLEYLKKDEISFINLYFHNIGKSDCKTQKEFLTASKVTIDKMCENSNKDCSRYGDLYIKLSFLFGLAIIVLIV